MSSPAAPRRRSRAWPSLVVAMLLLAATLSQDGQLLIADMLSVRLAPRAGDGIARADRGGKVVQHATAMPGTSNPAPAPRTGARVAARATPASLRAPHSLVLAPASGPGMPDLDGLVFPLDPGTDMQVQVLAAHPVEWYASSARCRDASRCTFEPIPVSRGIWIGDSQIARYVPPPPAPEPKTWLMLLSGLLCASLVARRHACRRQSPGAA